MRTFASSKTTKMNYRKEHFIYTLMWILIYIYRHLWGHICVCRPIHI